MTERERIAVCVLGMHRSGTSAMAGVLNLLGVSLGKKLLKPAEDNPKGFYENEKITYFNDLELLPKLNTNWHDVNVVSLDSIMNLAVEYPEIVEKAIEILNEEFSDSELFGIKDPRMCIIFPFWENILWKFGSDIKIVFIFRNPLEVAHSLFNRNGFTLKTSLLLWAKHVLYAEYYSRKYDRVFVSYDDLLNNPEAVIKEIQSSLNIKLNLDDDKLNEIRNFLDNNLKNFNFVNFKSPVKELEFIEEIYRILLMLKEKRIKDTKDLHEMFDFFRDKYSKVVNSTFLELPDLRRPAVQLYFDKGSGFNEMDSVIRELSLSKKTYSFKFQIPPDIKALRLDPLNYPCVIRIKKVALKNGKNGELDLLSNIKTNAIFSSDNKFLFTTNDPQIFLNFNANEIISKESLELEVEIDYESIGYDALRKELEVFVEERNNLSSQVEVLNKELSTRNEEIERLRADLSVKDGEIRKLSEEILRLSSELDSIKSSVTWRAVMKWHSFVERVAPLGTRRRRWYDLGIKGLRILVGEGFKSFWKKYSTYVDNEKSSKIKNFVSNQWFFEQVFEQYNVKSDSESMPKISVIIVSFNSEDTIKDLINSIVSSNYPNELMEVIVVDNNSKDKTLHILGELKNKMADVGLKINVIANKKNYGFGKAVNLGVKHSDNSSEYLLLINPDSRLYSDTIQKLVLAAMSSRHMGYRLWEARQLPFEHPKIYNPVTLETSWASAAACLVCKKAFEEIGGFDENIFLYLEDVDLSWRLRLRDYKLMYVPSARVVHLTNPKNVKPSQYYNTVLYQFYLRYKYGDIADIFDWYLKYFYILKKSPNKLPREKLKLFGQFIRHVPLIPKAMLFRVKTRKNLKSFKPKFINYDFEVHRIGAGLKVVYDAIPSINLPKVSIIVRTVGRKGFLSEALMSIKNQTYPNIETVVVEDGPCTVKPIISKFREANMDIKYYCLGRRRGRTFAGNFGLSQCTGDYIMFLDEDDLLYADCVETMVHFISKNSRYKLVYSLGFEVPTEVISEEPLEYVEYSYRVVCNEDFNRKTLLHHNYIPIQCALFDRVLYDKAGGFDETLEVLEDWDLWIKYSNYTDFLKIPKVLSLYRVSRDEHKKYERQRKFDEWYWTVRAKWEKFMSEHRGEDS